MLILFLLAVHLAPFSKNVYFDLRRDHQKNFVRALRLWVGWRKEPMLGYVPKNDEKMEVAKGYIYKYKLVLVPSHDELYILWAAGRVDNI